MYSLYYFLKICILLYMMHNNKSKETNNDIIDMNENKNALISSFINVKLGKLKDNNIDNINYLDNKCMERDGRKLYKTNDFYKSLANLMTNNDFKHILNKYWNSEIEINSFIMYIHLYKYINEKFPDLSDYKKINMIKILIDNKDTRYIICKNFSNNFKINTKSFKQLIK